MLKKLKPIGNLSFSSPVRSALTAIVLGILSSAARLSYAQAPLPDLSLCGNGGGYGDAGLFGEYFANSDLSGTAAFTRRDVRIDFDFAGLSPAGSNSEMFRNFPSRGFSVRWSGQLLSRYSEPYQIKVLSTDGARVSIKEPGAKDFKTVIDTWQKKGEALTSKGTAILKVGEPADIRVEFRNVTAANAKCQLLWSSPSTPEQVIQPGNGIATNVYTEGFTDIIKSSPDQWQREGSKDDAKRDENGWPMEDAYNLIWQGIDKTQGTYEVTFNGKAELYDQFQYATFQDMAYDTVNNTSTCKMVVTNTDHQNFYLHFKNTQRDASSPINSGITNLRIYRPLAIGGGETFPLNSLFVPTYEKSLGKFIALRWMSGTNWNQQREWSDRTRPDYSTQAVVLKDESGFEGNGIAWEYKVALCNETGKDLYVCIPEPASDTFITKLAQLIRYGSDAKEPYTAPQAHPVYPPLNSNLKVYVEYSNEVWNVGFAQFHQNLDELQAEIKKQGDEAHILAYDQADPIKLDINVGWNRRHVYQTVRASNLFRKVFGDDQMNEANGRIRILHYWQYDNSGWPPTAFMQMQFLNDFYNNGDGKVHVQDPHPPSYYIWGGGGATYYNGENEQGNTGLIGDGSFEVPSTVDHLEKPSSAGWSFEGPSGIAKAGGPFRAPSTPEQLKLAEERSGNQPAAPGEKREEVNEQTAYLCAGGSLSTTVTFPNGTANIYGVRIKGARRKGGSEQPFQILVDGQNLTPVDLRPGDDWSDYYSQTFKADPGSKHAIKIFATTTDKADAVSFIDQIKLCSVDAIFAAALPASSYNGNTSDSVSVDGYQTRLDVTGLWAQIHGIRFCGYEGGWALGGDGGGSPVQNWAKFNDPRAKEVQLQAINAFYRAGGVLNTFGTYSYSTNWDEADSQPLGLAFLEANHLVPSMPSPTISLPADLTPESGESHWGDKNALSTGGKIDSRTMIGWKIWSPEKANYNLTLSSLPGGTAQLLVDGVLLVKGKSGSDLVVSVDLNLGLHTLRIKTCDGDFVVNGVKVVQTK